MSRSSEGDRGMASRFLYSLLECTFRSVCSVGFESSVENLSTLLVLENSIYCSRFQKECRRCVKVGGGRLNICRAVA